MELSQVSFTGRQREFLDYMLPEDREEQLEIGKRYYQEGGKFDTKFRIMRQMVRLE